MKARADYVKTSTGKEAVNATRDTGLPLIRGLLAQIDLPGPIVVASSCRHASEAVELANNTNYGLTASVWTENMSTALEVAPKLEAGTVWINSANLFDAASGFGGYRDSGFAREGGNEGMYEYLI